ncbi:MAG TPA: S-layer protein, partial [Planctomycetaceae bacterium]|nr:S-layer protein [Planctomycetaceae bacterium]
GRDSRQQLLVTGFADDEKTFDLTRAVKYKLKDPQLASVNDLGIITPAASGKTELQISWGKLKQTLPVIIEQGETFLPLSFENDIAPILTRRGCNGGGCHGKSDG